MTLSRDAFATIATDFFRQGGEARPIHHDAGRHRLVLGEGQGPWSFVKLADAQKEYEGAPPGERERVLARRFWSSLRSELNASREALFARVLPRVRDLAWFSAVRRQVELELGGDQAAIEESLLPHRELNEELAVHLVYELPTSVMELSSDRLRAWDITFDELYAKAVENLRARSKAPFEKPAPGVFVSPYHDSLDASRIVLTDAILALELKGQPVALAPTHDILLVTGDQDDDGLVAISGWGEEALLEPRAHCAVAMRLEDGAWKPWLPPREHPSWAKFRVLALQTMASAYTRQKEVLDALLEANGHDIFVAGLRAFRSQRGDIFTACAWTAGVEALLPQTDRIDFVRVPPGGDTDTAEIWSTTFEVARKVVGSLMEASGDVPERWRVRGFPSPEQLEQMAKEGPVPE